MPSYRKITVDGQVRLMVDEPPAPPKNPSLLALNEACREQDAERRDEVDDAVKAATAAIQMAFVNRRRVNSGEAAKGMQKALRPPQGKA